MSIIRASGTFLAGLVLLAACGGGGGGGGTESGQIPYTVSVTVSGLNGTVVLQNNLGNNLSTSVNGSAAFSATLVAGADYSVTVLTQPAGQSCNVASGSGKMPAANVAIAVGCTLIAPVVSTQPGIKKLQFSWTANPVASVYYKVLESPDGSPNNYTQLGGNLTSPGYTLDLSGTLLSQRVNYYYIVQSCDNFGCTGSSTPLGLASQLVNAIGYFKASNTGANDFFGAVVALSSDGSTLAVAAPEEDSTATGIDGNQADNTRTNAGAVYVFVRVAGAWSQQAYVKASNANSPMPAGAGTGFGYSLALSGDGNTLAVGAPFEGNSATGIGASQVFDCSPAPVNCAANSGAAYVFTRSGTAWSQQVYIKPPFISTLGGVQMNFGAALKLSADGNRLAVGAPGESSPATGVNGSPSTFDCTTIVPSGTCAFTSGAAYTYTRSGAVWSQQAYIKASNTGPSERFGRILALSGDGNTLAAAAPIENSGARTINGNQIDDCLTTNSNCAANSGAVYAFSFNGSTWSQQAYIKASNADAQDFLGNAGIVALSPQSSNGLPITGVAIALSNDGNTLAVGATAEASAATGINGAQGDNSLVSAGAVYVFSRSGTTWTQQAYVKASNTGANDNFGGSLALSTDGNLLAVGAGQESSSATGINGNQLDNNATSAGAVYLFTRSGTAWTQQTYLKASNTRSTARFGNALAFSGDGSTLAVGSRNEASGATGIAADQSDTSSPGAGAVYLY